MVSSSKSECLARKYPVQCHLLGHQKANGSVGDYVPAARMSLPARVVLRRGSCVSEPLLWHAISRKSAEEFRPIAASVASSIHAAAWGRCVAEPGVYPFASRPTLAREWGGHRVQPALICRVLSASRRGSALRRRCGWRRCNLYSSIISGQPIDERPYAMNRRTPTQVRLRADG